MNIKCRQAIDTYHMLSQGDSVIVGLSGGADSCALLHCLCGLREDFGLRLTAVHINHGIRGEEAARDAKCAADFCQTLDVPFRLYECDIPTLAAERGMGLEECGRTVRYEIFAREAAKVDGKIATAHTLSDSVETMLLHMIRGCSLHGLRGIPPVRGNIIRPLIFCQRSDIETYCAENHIDYVTDSTNLSTDYTRNKIRLELLPLMREINPAVVNALGRLAESAAADDEYLNMLAAPLAQEFCENGRTEGILAAPEPVASRALIRICSHKWHITPEHRHLTAMLSCMRAGRGSVNLPGDHLFRVNHGQMLFLSKKDLVHHDKISNEWQCEFGMGEIITPGSQKIFLQLVDQTKYDIIRKFHQNVFANSLDYDTIKQAIFRFRREGDSFTQAGRGVTKSLKKLFNENKIPVEHRYTLPLLDCGGRIAWIYGVGVGEGFQVTDHTRNIVIIHTEPAVSLGTAERKEELSFDET